MKAARFNIQKFCTHDGPGIRTAVFMAGCPLRCKWCHNPEGQKNDAAILLHKERCIGCGLCEDTGCRAQIFVPDRAVDRDLCTGCGRCAEVCPAGAVENAVRWEDTDEIIKIVMQDRAFYGENGGITLTGGEPLYQPEAALELLRLARNNGITTAVETSGCFDGAFLPELVRLTDIFLWDFKDSDPKRFYENTGGSLESVLNNLLYADSLGAAIRLRCILIHGVNDYLSHAQAICRLANSMQGLAGVDIIKYHPMGKNKYAQLGIPNSFDSAEKIPTPEKIELFTHELGKI